MGTAVEIMRLKGSECILQNKITAQAQKCKARQGKAEDLF
jgi:hypothetical protein